MTYTDEKKVRGRGEGRESKGAQASHEVVFGLRYACQAMRQVGGVLQRGDASRLGQGVDTPWWPGAPQGCKDLRGAYGVAQAQASQGVFLGQRAQHQHIVTPDREDRWRTLRKSQIGFIHDEQRAWGGRGPVCNDVWCHKGAGRII